MNDVITECGVFLSIINVVRPPVKEGYYILKYNSLSSYSGWVNDKLKRMNLLKHIIIKQIYKALTVL